MKKTFIINGEAVVAEDVAILPEGVSFKIGEKTFSFAGFLQRNGEISLKKDGKNNRGFVSGKNVKGSHHVILQGLEASVNQLLPGRKASEGGDKRAPHTAPMPGMVQKVFVSKGDSVTTGQKLLVMEAMKLQLNIEAAFDGVVKEIRCNSGGLVADGDLLVVVEPA
ncbi:MAG: acetyl-CoA carboxylase biotin carboxyl carrier protein subunit [Alphaproteobacteria bacterium]|nr:acetyl-CoA carboxylase biotin carboxyl carrier protein subunit [Alphaproteobacteria bacterium]